jgi:MFS family permease
MGMRSATDSPNLLWLAAAAQGLEAAGLLVVVALNLSDLASGQTYQRSNAIAVIGIELIVAIGVAAVAAGIVRVRPWSRAPAVMTQVFTVIIGIVLIQAHRFGWGLPALVFAVAGLAGLFAPTSLQKLHRPGGTDSPHGGTRPPIPPSPR